VGEAGGDHLSQKTPCAGSIDLAIPKLREGTREALERAVTPSDADVMVARGVVLDMLAASGEPVLLTAFEDAWATAQGSRRPAERTTLQAITSADPNRRYADPDPRDPHLMEFEPGILCGGPSHS